MFEPADKDTVSDKSRDFHQQKWQPPSNGAMINPSQVWGPRNVGLSGVGAREAEKEFNNNVQSQKNHENRKKWSEKKRVINL